MSFLLTLVLLSVCLMAVFANSMYFSVSLLFIVLFMSSFLVSYLSLSSLTFFLLMLVYLGAMMILIGYVCAVSPNVLVKKSTPLPPLILFISSVFFIVPTMFSNSCVSSINLVDFFYSSWGVLIFSSLVFLLALTLLIVTSQYVSPNGPFRSVSI